MPIQEDYEYTFEKTKCPYCLSRGISEDVAERYHICEDKDYVYFPVFDEKGKYVYTTKRSVKGKFFHIPSGADKVVYLANVFKNNKGTIAICESQFNALSFIQNGIGAVALFGTGSDKQWGILKRFECDEFILALDNDNAGIRGKERLYDQLKYNYRIKSIVYNDSRDINDYQRQGKFNELMCKWGI